MKLKHILLALSLGLAIPSWVEARLPAQTINYAISRTVWLLILDKNLEEVASCSGAFINPKGLILTASHCIRATEDIPDIKIKKGELIHPEGLTVVGLNSPDRVKPSIELVAKRVIDNPLFDVAVLQVIGRISDNGPQKLPDDFSVPYLVIGDHDSMQIGDEIAVMGFPGSGGDTITVAPGAITGFTADEKDPNRRYEMKHDAEAGPGSSGGPVINDKAEILAIHVRIYTNAKTAAKSMRAILTKPIFEDLVQILPQNPQLAAYLQGVNSNILKNMPVVAQTPTSPSPTAPVTPPIAQVPTTPPQPTTPLTPPAPITQPTAAGVIVQSRIIDAVSGAGIPGALVGVFRPGTNPQTVTKNDVVATGYADQQGYIQTKPPFQRGGSYPVVIMAKGYQSLSLTLDVPNNAPDILEKEDVYLRRK